jgi:hypothetical protein
MSTIKDGKKPVSAKASSSPSFFSHDALFGNNQRIPEDVQADLDSQGLVGRWLNAKKLYDNQGYHKMGWVPYKRKGPATGVSEFRTGSDPEGIVRRGDMILGVRTKAKNEEHKAYLKHKASVQEGSQAQSATELRKLMGKSGKVIEGYEDNE